MRTPQAYQKAVKSEEITNDILKDCLKSISKYIYIEKSSITKTKEDYRYRNKMLNSNHMMNFIVHHTNNKKKYHNMKLDLLSLLKHIRIERKILHHALDTIFEDDEGFNDVDPDCLIGEGTQFNGYFDVRYKVIRNKDKPLYKYYLTYDLDGKKFYSLLLYDEVAKYSHLKFNDVYSLDDEFEENYDCLSINFIEKVCDLVKNLNEKVLD